MPVLDLNGLKCPLPVLAAQKRLATMRPGESLTVLSNDGMALVDIPHMCRELGHRLVGTHRDGAAARFEIEVGDRRS